MDESNPYEPPRSELLRRHDLPLGPNRSRRFSLLPLLLGALVGLIAGAFITPPFTLKPIHGDLTWLLQFTISGGIAGAILDFAMRGAGPPAKR